MLAFAVAHLKALDTRSDTGAVDRAIASLQAANDSGDEPK
jgi:hypothetical protein